MSTISVLIVEDESIVAMEIESFVSNKLGYNVIGICSSAEATLNLLEKHTADIILMDICIKGEMDGIELAEVILKQHPKTQIIFLTAHMDDYNVDRAIKLDPVAYLSKPFNREELRVVMKIAIQRMHKKNDYKTHNPDHLILDEEYCFNETTQTLFCCDEPIHLTQKEGVLLYLLLQNKNKIVDTYTIEQYLWPDKSVTANTLRTLVRRLREKLKHKFIQTIPSQGYRLTLPKAKTINT